MLRSLILGLLVLLPCLANADKETQVKVGVILPLTGEFESYGELVRRAVLENHDENIRYIFEDEGCEAKKALSAFRKLTEIDKVKLFIGPCCGSAQQVIAPLLKKSEALAVFPTSSSTKLFEASDNRAFSSQYSIEDESAFNAKEIYRLGYRKVLLLFVENQFSRAHEDSFREKFAGQVIETIALSTSDSSALKSAVLKIRAKNPDAVYVPDAAPFFSGFLSEMKKMGLSGKAVFSVYSVQSKNILEAEGGAADGLIYSYPDIEQNEALSYFPELGARILAANIKLCLGDTKCIRDNFERSGNFDKYGIYRSALILKQISSGKFKKFDN